MLFKSCHWDIELYKKLAITGLLLLIQLVSLIEINKNIEYLTFLLKMCILDGKKGVVILSKFCGRSVAPLKKLKYTIEILWS